MKIIETPSAPPSIGTYSQAIQVGELLYSSGQIGISPETGCLVSSDFTEQARQVFQNIANVLAAADCDTNNVVKMTVYVSDLNDFATLNKIMAENFSPPYPARAAVEVKRLPQDALIEVDVIASCREKRQSAGKS